MEEKKKASPLPRKGVWVCVEQFGNYDLAGKLYSMTSGRGAEFENIADLLLKIDTLLDKENNPQAFQEKRSFQRKSREGTSGEEQERASEEVLRIEAGAVTSQRGRYGTCHIEVESRMNTSWQGVVKDESGKMLGVFESELELIGILLRVKMTEDTGK